MIGRYQMPAKAEWVSDRGTGKYDLQSSADLPSVQPSLEVRFRKLLTFFSLLHPGSVLPHHQFRHRLGFG